MAFPLHCLCSDVNSLQICFPTLIWYTDTSEPVMPTGIALEFQVLGKVSNMEPESSSASPWDP